MHSVLRSLTVDCGSESRGKQGRSVAWRAALCTGSDRSTSTARQAPLAEQVHQCEPQYSRSGFVVVLSGSALLARSGIGMITIGVDDVNDAPVSETSSEPSSQSSLSATAFGVTFIFGSYSATSTERPRSAYFATSCPRQDSHGP